MPTPSLEAPSSLPPKVAVFPSPSSPSYPEGKPSPFPSRQPSASTHPPLVPPKRSRATFPSEPASSPLHPPLILPKGSRAPSPPSQSKEAVRASGSFPRTRTASLPISSLKAVPNSPYKRKEQASASSSVFITNELIWSPRKPTKPQLIFPSSNTLQNELKQLRNHPPLHPPANAPFP